jgi:hypothetical protein
VLSGKDLGTLPGFRQHVVKDLQRPESKEEDRQEDVYSRDAAGGLKTDRTFYCPSGSFLVSVMGSQR